MGVVVPTVLLRALALVEMGLDKGSMSERFAQKHQLLKALTFSVGCSCLSSEFVASFAGNQQTDRAEECIYKRRSADEIP